MNSLFTACTERGRKFEPKQWKHQRREPEQGPKGAFCDSRPLMLRRQSNPTLRKGQHPDSAQGRGTAIDLMSKHKRQLGNCELRQYRQCWQYRAISAKSDITTFGLPWEASFDAQSCVLQRVQETDINRTHTYPSGPDSCLALRGTCAAKGRYSKIGQYRQISPYVAYSDMCSSPGAPFLSPCSYFPSRLKNTISSFDLFST